jgi:hypothetical protein
MGAPGEDLRRPTPRLPGADVTQALLVEPAAITASQSLVVARRRSIEQAGEYDPSFPAAGDLDFMLRLSLVARFWPIDEPLAVCRATANSISSDLDVVEAQVFRVLRKFFTAPHGAPYAALQRRSYASFAIVFSGMRYQAGDVRRAIGWGLRAAWWDPRKLIALLSFGTRRLRPVRRASPGGPIGRSPKGKDARR